MIHMAILLCASRFEAWTFVDNVDHLDHRFKLVADEASTYVDTLAYMYLTLFSLILVVVNSLSTLSTLSQSPRPCWLCAWVKLSFIQCPTIVQPLSTLCKFCIFANKCLQHVKNCFTIPHRRSRLCCIAWSS